ncbi:helix-turn-helix domain-containing protein [Clostridioides sp. ZZV15-6598]|uniref:helix-turn-helix domain-containing protein n=1 Tax=Clostridioides sp. ZZV15-6598 TaxID=2811501 RepID=UPI001D12A909|nr:helix-turn-helix domain-containing protein [Clostridioides sp. ZZV15-6598]
MSVALQFIDTEDLVKELMGRDDTVDFIKMFLDRKGIKRMELMTIGEFCEYLKISDVTARNMAREAMVTKDFIALKIRRKYMIDRITFEEFIMKNAMKDKDVMKKRKGVI